MIYSIESRDRIYLKGYGFMSFAISMINKYGKKLVDTDKKYATDAIKTASKRSIQKPAEATVDLIGNKIADEITSVINNNNNNNNNNDNDVKLATHKRRYISREEIQQIIDELRLVPKNY